MIMVIFDFLIFFTNVDDLFSKLYNSSSSASELTEEQLYVC